MLGLEAPIGSGSAQAVSGMVLVDGFALTYSPYTRRYGVRKPCVCSVSRSVALELDTSL